MLIEVEVLACSLWEEDEEEIEEEEDFISLTILLNPELIETVEPYTENGPHCWVTMQSGAEYEVKMTVLQLKQYIREEQEDDVLTRLYKRGGN